MDSPTTCPVIRDNHVDSLYYDMAGAVTHEEREQPWTALEDELEKEKNAQPVGTDFFPCVDGFYAHSLAA